MTDKTSSSKEILSINIDNISYKVPKFIINGKFQKIFQMK